MAIAIFRNGQQLSGFQAFQADLQATVRGIAAKQRQGQCVDRHRQRQRQVLGQIGLHGGGAVCGEFLDHRSRNGGGILPLLGHWCFAYGVHIIGMNKAALDGKAAVMADAENGTGTGHDVPRMRRRRPVAARYFASCCIIVSPVIAIHCGDERRIGKEGLHREDGAKRRTYSRLNFGSRGSRKAGKILVAEGCGPTHETHHP